MNRDDAEDLTRLGGASDGYGMSAAGTTVTLDPMRRT
jgi:hypothetical protein